MAGGKPEFEKYGRELLTPPFIPLAYVLYLLDIYDYMGYNLPP